MAATSAERVLYAAKSRKWNSTQNNKFPSEFPTEHAANLEWVKKTEEEAAARKRTEEEARERRGQIEPAGKIQDGAKRNRDGSGKWWIIGVVGLIVAMRAWQRYKEVSFQ
jgi:hypothetical protein